MKVLLLQLAPANCNVTGGCCIHVQHASGVTRRHRFRADAVSNSPKMLASTCTPCVYTLSCVPVRLHLGAPSASLNTLPWPIHVSWLASLHTRKRWTWSPNTRHRGQHSCVTHFAHHSPSLLHEHSSELYRLGSMIATASRTGHCSTPHSCVGWAW